MGSTASAASDPDQDEHWHVVDPSDAPWDEYSCLTPPAHLVTPSFANHWEKTLKDNLNLVEDLFTCIICWGEFQQPKLLACGHTYCEKCLEALWRQRGGKYSVRCPICRHLTMLKPTGVAGLASDFRISQAGEALRLILTNMTVFNERRRAACAACPKGKPREGIFFCRDCKLRFCDACSRRHEDIPDFEDHTVQSIVDVVFCASHDLACTHSCMDCRKSICPVCVLGPCGQHMKCKVAFRSKVKHKFSKNVPDRRHSSVVPAVSHGRQQQLSRHGEV